MSNKEPTSIKTLNAKMEGVIQRFNQEMENFKKALADKSHNSTPNTPNNNIDDITTKFEQFEASTKLVLSDLRADITSLETKLVNMEDKFHNLELNKNRSKLMIHGISEQLEVDLIDVILSIFNENLKLNCQEVHIKHYYRMKNNKNNNSVNGNSSSRPRPVVVVFNQIWMRDLAFRRKRQLYLCGN